MADKPSTVGEYIAALPEHAAVKIAAVRQLVHETAPNLSETLKWNSPAFIHPDGMIMLVTSAHKTHINVVFSVSTREHFESELGEIPHGKGSLRFDYTGELPGDLLTRMVQFRVKEFEGDGVNWK